MATPVVEATASATTSWFGQHSRMDAKALRTNVDFPFAGGTFPDDLGAFISRTVLDGTAPVRYVQHTHDNRWVLTDAVGDPNEEGALLVACIWHAIEHDATLEAMTDLPVGSEAVRDDPGCPWMSRAYDDEDEDDQ
jgi:hypothetical protein